MKNIVLIFFINILLFLPQNASAQESKIALIIGNSNYSHAIKLENPINDASDLAQVLKKGGFQIVVGLNLKQHEMQKKIKEFARASREYDIGLLFYAGHALQYDNENYLIPIDARIDQPGDVGLDAIGLNFIIDQMRHGPRSNIIILDACRENPFVKNIKRSLGTRSAMVQRGLFPVRASTGFFIAYSTAPNDTAADGVGHRNSPFTAALKRHLSDQSIDIYDLMISVRKDVKKATSNRQIPWSHDSLTRRIRFVREWEMSPQCKDTLEKYRSTKPAWSFAISKNGHCFYDDNETTVEAVNELVLSGCRKKWKTECRVLESFAGDWTPHCPSTLKRYEKRGPGKAIAVTQSGKCWFRTRRMNKAVAEKEALENCERDYETKCRIYASDGGNWKPNSKCDGIISKLKTEIEEQGGRQAGAVIISKTGVCYDGWTSDLEEFPKLSNNMLGNCKNWHKAKCKIHKTIRE